MSDVEEFLSESQRACLRLVAEGLSSKEIAQRTGLSYQTVDQYLSRAANALGASNRREAARKFLQRDTQFSKSELRPPNLAEGPASATMEALADQTVREPVQHTGRAGWLRYLQIPPIGGQEHDFSIAQVIETAARIALICIVTLIAATVILMGLMRLLG